MLPRKGGLRFSNWKPLYMGIYVFTSTFTVLNSANMLLSRTQHTLLSEFYPTEYVDLHVKLLHVLISIALLTLVTYTLFRVKISITIVILTVIFIYTSLLDTNLVARVSLYLLNIFMLLFMISYGRSLYLRVERGSTSVVFSISSFIQDFIAPIAITSILMLILHISFKATSFYIGTLLPEPYRFIFSPIISTRLGSFMFILIVFFIALWVLREVIEIPVLYLTIRGTDARAEIRREIEKELKSLVRGPRAIRWAASTLVGLIVSYILWFIFYSKVSAYIRALGVQSYAEWFFTILLLTATTILIERIVALGIRFEALNYKHVSLRGPIIYLIMLIALVIIFNSLLCVQLDSIVRVILLQPTTYNDPMTGFIENLNHILGVELSEKTKELETMVRMIMKILWA